MKKLIAALIMLALLFLNLPQPLERVVVKEGAAVIFHLDKRAEGAEFKGNTYRLECSGADACRIRKTLTGIIGTEIAFDGGSEDVEALLERLRPANLKREEFGSTVLYTGYSALLKGWIKLGNGRINFQIALSDAAVTVGSPVILGSF